jgi:peptidylprolyl isomerase
MKSIFRPLILTAMAFAIATPLAAQEEPASAPAPAATETPAPSATEAPATETPAAAPTMTPDQYMGNPEYMLDLDLSTGGRVVIQLYPNAAPNHVERVKQLARQGFYDGVKFHRVIDGFMAQTGDPTATGQGGSSLPDLKAEFNDVPHMRGTVSMARAESPDSANSQFFIMLQPRFSLDHRYTVFGRVVSGMQYVDAIQKGEPPAVMSRMVQVSVAADNKPMPPASALVEAQPAPAEVTVDQLNAPLRP